MRARCRLRRVEALKCATAAMIQSALSMTSSRPPPNPQGEQSRGELYNEHCIEHKFIGL